jgi:Protein of unknown function (DUF551)
MADSVPSKKEIGNNVDWISLKSRKPKSYQDILLTDGTRQWVGQTFDNLDIYLASHPDYNREPKNEYGSPFITHSKPTHWMNLPSLPREEENER